MDAVKISQRLRDLRNEYDNGKSISTKTLAELLNERCKEKGIKGISEQTLKDYERPGFYGKTENITKGTAILGMRIEYLDMLADFYEVSTDYILCRSNKKTPDVNAQAAMEYTGLSEKAVTELRKANCDFIKPYFHIPELDKLLVSDEFWTMLYYLSLYRHHCRVKRSRPIMIENAEARGDAEAVKRHKKDLKFSVSDKEVCWAGMFQTLVKIAENIGKEVEGNGKY